MKIDHIGVAVSSLEESKAFYEALGLVCGGEEEVPEQRVKVAFFPAGEGRLELLESTDPEGPIGRFVTKKGPGLHHVCLAVPDIRAAMEALKSRGYTLIDQEPKAGAGGHLVAFVHPKSTGGVLLELSAESAGMRAANRETDERGELGKHRGALSRLPSSPALRLGPIGSDRVGPRRHVVVLYLHSPREKHWGLLMKMDAAGLWLRGIELDSFEAWARQQTSEEPAHLGLSTFFVPFLRVEKVVLDERTGPVPSMRERFEAITGKSLGECMNAEAGSR